MGIRGGEPLVTNRSSVAPADRKRRRLGGPSTDQEDLWFQFPIAAGLPSRREPNTGDLPFAGGDLRETMWFASF